MRKFLTVSLAAVTAVSAVAFSTSAAADHRRNHDNDNTGVAIVAGVVGLAIGAALASSSNRSRYDYGGRYGYGGYGGYNGGYGYSPYGSGYGYNYSSPYSYGYGASPYGYGYGASPYGYGYDAPRYYKQRRYDRCRTVSRWDPYIRRHVRYRTC